MIKAAVVGFGFMGKTHAMNILKNKDFKLKAIVDSDPGLFTGELNSNSGNIRTGDLNSGQISDVKKYADLDLCLRNEDLDAVFICVHTGMHYSLAIKALSYDKHLFIEKPFCLDIAQAEEIIRLAGEKGKMLMAGHVVRFMQPYVRLKQMIDSGEFGEIEFLYLTRFCGIPSWGQWKDKNVTEKSGGALFDLAIHDIDFAGFALGIPDEIQSTCFPGIISSHDYVSATWTYKDKNTKVRIESGNTFHSHFPFQAGYIAKFERASVVYNTMKGNIIQVAGNDGLKELTPEEAADGYYDEIDYFAGCINKNIIPEKCTPSSSLESVKLCYRHIKKI